MKTIKSTISVNSYSDLLDAFKAEKAMLSVSGNISRQVKNGMICYATDDYSHNLHLMKAGCAIGFNLISFEDRNGTFVYLSKAVWFNNK